VQQFYLFDTNILVYLIRETDIGARIRRQYAPLLVSPRPFICVVSEGELRSLALQWGWSGRKLGQMEFLLGYFWRLPIDTAEMFQAYAAIDADSERRGFSMGKNDLWIAAAAQVTGATLVTTDKDFNHLQPDFLFVDWIDPELEQKQSM
jgi:predicted nucleic acid-binding protein